MWLGTYEAIDYTAMGLWGKEAVRLGTCGALNIQYGDRNVWSSRSLRLRTSYEARNQAY